MQSEATILENVMSIILRAIAKQDSMEDVRMAIVDTTSVSEILQSKEKAEFVMKDGTIRNM